MSSPRKHIHPAWLEAPPKPGLPFWVRSALTLTFLGYSALLIAGGGLLFALAIGFHFDLHVMPPQAGPPPTVGYQATPYPAFNQPVAPAVLNQPYGDWTQPVPENGCIGACCEMDADELPPAPIPPDPSQPAPAVETSGPDPADFIVFDHEFITGSDTLTPEGEKHLEDMVAQMTEGPLPVLVEHPDSSAPSDLANQRKRAVARFLAARGVDSPEQTVMMSRDFGRLSMSEFSAAAGCDVSEAAASASGCESLDAAAPAPPPLPPEALALTAAPVPAAEQVVVRCLALQFDVKKIVGLLAGDEPIPQPVASLLKSLIDPESPRRPRTLEADDARWLEDASSGWAKRSLVEVIAAPTLVTAIGQAANARIGGEVPVVAGEIGTETTAVSEPFGTTIDCTAWRLANDRLRLHVSLEQGELSDRHVRGSGFTVIKRGLASVVEFAAGETVALGPVPGPAGQASDSAGAMVVFLSADLVESGEESTALSIAPTERGAATHAIDAGTLPNPAADHFRMPASALCAQSGGPQVALDLELIEFDRTAARQQIAEGQASEALLALLDWSSSEDGPTCEPSDHESLVGAIEQLADNPALRVVARPRLGAVCGQAASYGSGNAFPVYVPGADATRMTGHVELRRYGTRVDCSTQLLPDGLLKIDLDVEHGTLTGQSDANGVPTVDTTRVKSTLQARDQETMIVGGIWTRTEPTDEDQPASDKMLVLMLTPRVVDIVPRALEKSPAAEPKKVAIAPKEDDDRPDLHR